MDKVSDLLNQAQNMGIKVYLQNNQVKVDIPWPVDSIPDPARYVLGELRRRQAEVLASLDPDQADFWQTVLTNAYCLRYPKDGEFHSMRELHGILEKLKNLGARLSKMESRFERGKVYSLNLKMGNMPWPDWNWYQSMVLPQYNKQLDWLLKISVMGAARDYVDLGVELPAEWVSDVMGKHGARIAELRTAIIEEMIKKSRRIYFKTGDKILCLAPGKTGLGITELTPEEAVIVTEAQDAGLLPPGSEGARSALKWVS